MFVLVCICVGFNKLYVVYWSFGSYGHNSRRNLETALVHLIYGEVGFAVT